MPAGPCRPDRETEETRALRRMKVVRTKEVLVIRKRRRVVAVPVVSLVLIGLLASSSLTQENLSSGRGLGIGAGLSLPPWPFVSYFFSDQVGVNATGIIFPGIVMVSVSLQYRALDSKALDLLANLGLGVIVGGIGSPLGDVFVSVGTSLEYSFSRSLAVLASVGLSLSSSGLSPTYGASVVYYF